MDAIAVRAVGAEGGAAGVIGADAADEAEVPAEFEAVTVKVYDVPFVKPVMEHAVVETVQK